jgi:hypothetical protein
MILAMQDLSIQRFASIRHNQQGCYQETLSQLHRAKIGGKRPEQRAAYRDRKRFLTASVLN